MSSTISLRESIRWLPDAASEPTHTIVLTGRKTSVFIDVRFLKDSNDIDWAFGGYRSVVREGDTELIKFTHLIDSRTRNPSQMTDYGSNTGLPDGTTLETGEMINPATGKLTAYEEIWRDVEVVGSADGNTSLFLHNADGTSWYARVGDWQLALGRDSADNFWAFQARRSDKKWVVERSTRPTGAIILLSDDILKNWAEGSKVQWNEDHWLILEKS
ncbi:hypothetical protein D9757_003622 [Collybiopsis confluens]|uniref:Protein HRI1 n=1 Tax=Collybiopsis confluens TaxID=2823264 RepID=A0A8H5MDG6_9AGAR|nr:hypothetical protein D9757_003622 [Collybiopsis confluens]